MKKRLEYWLIYFETIHPDQDETKTRRSKMEANETRPRRDCLKHFVQDPDEAESLNTFSFETEIRPRLTSFTGV